jgi:hypothetical protein
MCWGAEGSTRICNGGSVHTRIQDTPNGKWLADKPTAWGADKLMHSAGLVMLVIL